MIVTSENTSNYKIGCNRIPTVTLAKTVKESTYEGCNKAKHKDEEDKATQQLFVNQRIPIVTSATKSDRNVCNTKRDWSKGIYPEDDENVATSPP